MLLNMKTLKEEMKDFHKNNPVKRIKPNSFKRLLPSFFLTHRHFVFNEKIGEKSRGQSRGQLRGRRLTTPENTLSGAVAQTNYIDQLY